MSKRPISSDTGSSALPANAAKRCRSSLPQDQQHEPAPFPYPRLEAARFPPEILALPHVLKQIDIYLMTNEEAVVEATKTGLADWLKGLLPRVDDISVAGAILEASNCGHVACVEVLLEKYAERDFMAYECWKKILDSVVAAATIGHLGVVEILLAKVSPGLDAMRRVALCGALRIAMSAAAAGGHLDVVKFMMQFALSRYDERFAYYSSALARAISAGQKMVVEYLLSVNGFTWNLKKAFVAAVGVKDNSLADRMVELYVQTSKKEDLFISMASDGHLDAVKYLYESGLEDSSLIGKAFVRAIKLMGTSMLKFLLNTGRVSSEAFDKGFMKAVVSSLNSMRVVSFLLEKKRASAKTINQVFVASSRSNILQILLEREHILDESICAVFERATGRLNECYSGSEKEDHIRIIELLYAKDCIPAEMIGTAFAVAASKGHSDLVALLRGDGRITAEMVGDAFAGAATRKESALMMSLYGADVSPDAVVAAFSNAAAQNRMCNVRELVKLLSNQDLVPLEFKHKAFVIAAQLEHDTVLRCLCESGNDLWPLTILREALAVSKQDEIKSIIRKVICDQLSTQICPPSH